MGQSGEVIYLSACLSVCMSVCLSTYLSTSLTGAELAKLLKIVTRVVRGTDLKWGNQVRLSMYLSVRLSVSLFACLSVLLSNKEDSQWSKITIAPSTPFAPLPPLLLEERLTNK